MFKYKNFEQSETRPVLVLASIYSGVLLFWDESPYLTPWWTNDKSCSNCSQHLWYNKQIQLWSAVVCFFQAELLLTSPWTVSQDENAKRFHLLLYSIALRTQSLSLLDQVLLSQLVFLSLYNFTFPIFLHPKVCFSNSKVCFQSVSTLKKSNLSREL